MLVPQETWSYSKTAILSNWKCMFMWLLVSGTGTLVHPCCVTKKTHGICSHRGYYVCKARYIDWAAVIEHGNRMTTDDVHDDEPWSGTVVLSTLTRLGLKLILTYRRKWRAFIQLMCPTGEWLSRWGGILKIRDFFKERALEKVTYTRINRVEC